MFGSGTSGSVQSNPFGGSQPITFPVSSASFQFGSAVTPSFGSTATPFFGSTVTPSFGSATTPLFGSTVTPSFGSAFGHPGSVLDPQSTKPIFGAPTFKNSTFGVPDAGHQEKVTKPSKLILTELSSRELKTLLKNRYPSTIMSHYTTKDAMAQKLIDEGFNWNDMDVEIMRTLLKRIDPAFENLMKLQHNMRNTLEQYQHCTFAEIDT